MNYFYTLDCDRPGDLIAVLDAITDIALADQQGGKAMPKHPTGDAAGRSLVVRVTLPDKAVTHVLYRGAHLKAFTAVYNAIRATERLNETKEVAK